MKWGAPAAVRGAMVALAGPRAVRRGRLWQRRTLPCCTGRENKGGGGADRWAALVSVAKEWVPQVWLSSGLHGLDGMGLAQKGNNFFCFFISFQKEAQLI
jgi:hypothetical protein